MIDLLFRLSNLITPANTVAAQVAEEPTAPDTIGLIVLAIIVGPVIILTIISIFGSPRTFRIPGLFIGSLVFLMGVIILGFAIIGVILGFIVPQ